MNRGRMGLADTLLSVLAPPHRAGRPFIAASVAIAVAGLFLTLWLVALGIAAALFCWFFFRDPERVRPPVPNALLAPADGRITSITLVTPPPELGLDPAPVWRIATFLSVLNVHVNRAPAAGQTTAIAYHAGRFLNAAHDKASDENERNALAFTLAGGETIAVVQIAGLIARRILCDLRPGQHVQAGQRFGMIRFGSRTDLYLPAGVTPMVAVGQTAIGGETVMAILSEASGSAGWTEPVPVLRSTLSRDARSTLSRDEPPSIIGASF